MPLTLRGVLLTALASGLLAGLVFFGVQSVTTRPLIVQAEIYEQSELHAAASMQSHTTDVHGWEPEGGSKRTAYTLAADVLIGIGYALLLVGAISVSGRTVALASGLAWGAASFLVFAGAPSLGLPPELPGGHPADLLLRQAWWLGTAGATAVGLWLLVMQDRRWLRAAGVALLIVPHLIGAPQATGADTEAHAALSIRFVWASLTANAALWATLGLAVGWLFPWFNRIPLAPSLRARV